MQDNVSVTDRVARWLLLACTVVGLTAMHTLGHAGSHHGAGHADRVAALSADQPAAVALETATGHGMAAPVMMGAAAVGLVSLMGDECAAAGCAQAGPAPEPGRHDAPAWSVCLAVLAGLSVAALLAWLLLGRTAGAGAAVRRLVARFGESRAPPWPGFGLQLVSISVIRI